jgi:hypothetical protein
MPYSELDKKLIKRAVQVEVKRVAVKLAAAPLASLYTPEMTNEGFGQYLINHAQRIAAYQPGTDVFNRYAAENNLTLDQAKYLHSIGGDFVNLARAPGAHAATNGNFDSASLMKLLETPEGKRVFARMVYGIAPQQHSDLLNIPAAGLRAAKDTPAYQALYQQTAAQQAQTSWWNPTGWVPTELQTLGTAAIDPAQRDLIIKQMGGQLLTGIGKGLDTNSPLARQMLAAGATGYLANKIDQWAPTDSMFGRGANSVGKFLLGLFSMVPGYESLVNWLANKDFMFGKQLKALPGQLQSAGTSIVSGTPQLPSPQQPPAPPAAQQPQLPSPQQAPQLTGKPSAQPAAVDPTDAQIDRIEQQQLAANRNIQQAGKVNQGPQNTRGGAVVGPTGTAVVPSQQPQVDNANNARKALNIPNLSI